MQGHEFYEQIAGAYRDSGATAADILCDRHDPATTAYTIADGDSIVRVTYGELRRQSIELANAMRQLGIKPGSRVATLLGKGPELITIMVATWRIGAVYLPLFTAFATPAIDFRLRTADAALVFTDQAQRGKLPVSNSNPWRVVVVGESAETIDTDISYTELIDGASPDEDSPSYVQGPDGEFVHIFTSGTTGQPKGVIHPLRHAAGWQSYLEYGLGVTADDTYWCAADPGWAYGLYSAVIAPLAAGTGTVLQTGNFEPHRAWSLITDAKVTNFSAAPTVYRAIRSAYPHLSGTTTLTKLSSCGEPLTPEVNVWALSELGQLVYDDFGQTEVGMIFSNPHHPDLAKPVVPGSMGYPLPGWSATILAEEKEEVLSAGEIGRVAIDTHNSPAMTFTNYQDPTKSASRFSADGRYYILGDLGSQDESGAFRFSARDDDVIIMAGYRIGPFEIESVLSKHPSIAESAAIAAPDKERGEVLEAYIVLRPDEVPSDQLATDIQVFVKQNYAAHAYPRRIHFVPELPKTPSGKIQRAVLRQQRREELEAETSE
ncbi:AMP-binding protein [Subtercola lobariae]|uniref:Acetyl-CoA synthetase n=1 Tax=Subtercola lobariae TaxID=1588641 RepID=A0A917ETR9_9MICO|nr:AMP-binding protein [Subtercola lobariae]GGF14840.1 acetyl-CoA synthetase [Subtercola lobariae]